ncbi:hypothetical protein H310_01233 [Aphanomyces invadans]|uniref:Major facilitator superfamily (MFS) profile domain-containing protein n=1 Tax=Aphanomyces invadans TaxID=157072 RepID=A0A024US36_9STRA|nr:hypothetical protein H310_01233 [Aphanomyces invadans]ETW08707.1 hypothetical protein H310_01233 [Aphanomyces invadans]|eukprot:XP_008862512.1 hypothetical protein H310_01233 [Aphanomyces invadans]
MLQRLEPSSYAHLVVLSLVSCGTCMLVFAAPDLFDDIHRDSSTNHATFVVRGITAILVAQLVVTPLCGALSDVYGRKRLFLASCIVHTSVMLALTCIPSKYAFQGCILLFATLNSMFAIGYSMAGDCSPKAQLTPCFGLLDAAFGVGVTTGLVVGRFMFAWHSSMPFVAASILNLVGLFITRRCVHETLDDFDRKPTASFTTVWQDSWTIWRHQPALLSLMVVTCCMHMCGAVHIVLYFYMNYRFGWQLQSQLVFFSYEGFTMVFCSTVVLRALWQRHWTNRRLVLSGLVAQAIALTATAFMTAGWQLYPLFVVGGLHFTSYPALRSIAHQAVGRHDCGCLHGQLAFLTSASMIAGERLAKHVVRLSIANDMQSKHPHPCPRGYHGVLDGYATCGGMPGLVFASASAVLMGAVAVVYLLACPPTTQRYKITLGPPPPRSICIEESTG